LENEDIVQFFDKSLFTAASKTNFFLVNDTYKKCFSTSSKHSSNTRALVIWGSNLSSTVNTVKIKKSTRNIIQLPLHIKSLVVGLLLSDGRVQKGKPHWNARLGFKQSLINFSYLWSTFNVLSHYCPSYPYLS
jgi:hypothetical protein